MVYSSENLIEFLNDYKIFYFYLNTVKIRQL